MDSTIYSVYTMIPLTKSWPRFHPPFVLVKQCYSCFKKQQAWLLCSNGFTTVSLFLMLTCI